MIWCSFKKLKVRLPKLIRAMATISNMVYRSMRNIFMAFCLNQERVLKACTLELKALVRPVMPFEQKYKAMINPTESKPPRGRVMISSTVLLTTQQISSGKKSSSNPISIG